jgi:hypothetical protein
MTRLLEFFGDALLGSGVLFTVLSIVIGFGMHFNFLVVLLLALPNIVFLCFPGLVLLGIKELIIKEN